MEAKMTRTLSGVVATGSPLLEDITSFGRGELSVIIMLEMLLSF
jgi:hypothetical protein